MKKHFYLYLCILLFCSAKINAQLPKSSALEINGKISELNLSDSVFLMYRASAWKNDTLAATTIAAGGSFKLRVGLPNRGRLCFLKINRKKDSVAVFLDEQVRIAGNASSWPVVRIMGSTINDDFFNFKTKILAQDASFGAYFYYDPALMYKYLINSATVAYAQQELQLFNTYLNQYNLYTKTLKNFIKQHPNSLLSPFLLTGTFMYKSINTCFEINEYLRTLTPYVMENSYYSPQILLIANDQNICYDFGGPLNTHAPEIDITDINGKNFSLYALLKGKKLILLDFWGSGCGICRENMPFYKQLLEQYGKNGLDVVAYAGDKDEKIARNAIKKDKTEAFHHLLGAANWIKLGKAYSQRGPIYITYLVDETGTIICDGFNNLDLYQLINRKLGQHHEY